MLRINQSIRKSNIKNVGLIVWEIQPFKVDIRTFLFSSKYDQKEFSLQTRAFKTSEINQVTHILTGDKLDYGLQYGQVLSTSMD